MKKKSGNSQDYQVLFVGQLFPDAMTSQILEQEILPIQTQRFGKALVAALRAGFHENVEVLSTAPLVDFPHSRLLFAPRAKWTIDDEIKATMVSFFNLAGLKHLTRFIVTLAFVSQWVLKNKNFKRIIILHGVQSCKLWGVLLAQVFGPCVTVSYLTDDLGIPLNWEKSLLKKMRLIDVNLMKTGLQKSSGVIAMTPNLAEKLAPGRPVLVMPAIRNSTPNTITSKLCNSNGSTFNIMYTGKLSCSYGLDLLLNTFSQANRSNWRLLISGWGEMESAVREFAQNNPQVEYFGLLNSEELSEFRQHADVFVNPKPSLTSTSSLAFPSKIVEYLGTGKPVVSTNLPIFDEEFRKHLILAQSDSPEELIKCLDNVMSWDDDQRESWRKETLRFVNEELSSATQGARIRAFVDSLKYRN
ncbi:MAG TPA: glycosyltransferase family 4 protein [Anaerolineales bacterium]|nr:glycosyltransferase family 4 protein [Anaerolineales bacterium]HLO31255.1 glycosyltransferase family 4 protein [Anaerolineales bacterium]